MKKKFKIAITREHVSTSLDIVKAVIDLMIDDDVPAADAVARVVAEKALEKYQGHIRAAFARVGIVLADGEVINVDVLLRVINEKSGLEIDTLSAAGVSAAVDTQLSAAISQRLGVELPTVMGGIDVIKTALINAAKDAVSSGRATGFLTAAIIKKIRTVKTFENAGLLTEDERIKTLARIRQKKYRRANREVWV